VRATPFKGQVVSEAAEPRLLILETSGAVGQVAVAEGHRLLGIRPLEASRRHARDLAPAVADLLRGLGWKPRGLDAVIVSRGPGSYTGLRDGLMSAKTLAYATGCALLAIDTFPAIAFQAPDQAVILDVIADAQQDKVYVQRFQRQAPDEAFLPANALSIQKFADWLESMPAGGWVSGPGLRGQEGRLPHGVRAVDAAHWDPQPGSLLELGLTRLQRGERDDVWAVEPLYLRPSAAEEQWQSRHG
jgi:tRNA threonylcarbamoyladenosine biosynthesis protein TsaB